MRLKGVEDNFFHAVCISEQSEKAASLDMVVSERQEDGSALYEGVLVAWGAIPVHGAGTSHYFELEKLDSACHSWIITKKLSSYRDKNKYCLMDSISGERSVL